jgi:hypothetical protein
VVRSSTILFVRVSGGSIHEVEYGVPILSPFYIESTYRIRVASHWMGFF